MKTFVVLCLCFVAALAAPSNPAPALEFSDVRDDLNQYQFKFITPEGTVVNESGRLVPSLDNGDKVVVYEGEYTFIGDDGKTYVTRYRSNPEGALTIEGDHLPKQVPVPVHSVS